MPDDWSCGADSRITRNASSNEFPSSIVSSPAPPAASTPAVAAGKHKTVNFVAAMAIAALKNLCAPTRLPFLFGGDGSVVMVAAPHWYYTFYSADAEFQSYFKIKADIDADMAATPENLATYGGLIRRMCRRAGGDGMTCDDAAVGWLLGTASRWAADRGKLSSQFGRVEDIVAEAYVLAGAAGTKSISRDIVVQAYENRRRRNARVEDRIQEGIADRTVMISTTGAAVGQVNALTVRDIGDHVFGTPSRVTARASVGRRGVLNIERDVGLGGPIQQKGAMVLQGWLSGQFARTYPLSFNVSITFEQSYGGVEGDSASLAELVAILSDLSGLPVKQGLAITGSVNQRGEVQAMTGWDYSSLTSSKGAWLKENKVRIVVQFGAKKISELPNVPLARDHASSPLDRDVLDLITLRQDIGRPYIAPPGLPADRLAILQNSFWTMTHDAGFLKTAEKSRFEISPTSAQESMDIIRKGYAASPEVVAKARKILIADTKGGKKKKK